MNKPVSVEHFQHLFMVICTKKNIDTLLRVVINPYLFFWSKFITSFLQTLSDRFKIAGQGLCSPGDLGVIGNLHK